MRDLRRIVIHHSASPLTTSFEQIRAGHVAKGWEDVAYHYVIDGTAMLHRGRPPYRKGAHAKGANADSIGVCVIGDNTDPTQRWTLAQQRVLTRIVHSLWDVFGPLELVPHCKAGTTATECPGLGDPEWEILTAMIHFDQAVSIA